VVISRASNRTRCDKRFSVADPSVLTLQCIVTGPNQYSQAAESKQRPKKAQHYFICYILFYHIFLSNMAIPNGNSR